MTEHETLERESTDILEMKLHTITMERSEEGLLDRLDAELQTIDWNDTEKDRVRAALTIALDVHKDDTRGPHPNSTHILRVAIRLISKSHLAIRDNPDLLIAALLHDTVEDHPDDYLIDPTGMSQEAKRETALNAVGELFGDNVQHYVSQLTNPILDKSLKKPERNELYREHVIDMLTKEPEAGIVKLSDFIDNCAGLKHNESPQKARKLAFKYYDLFPSFRLFIDANDYLNPFVKRSLLAQLDRAQARCESLMDGSTEDKLSM